MNKEEKLTIREYFAKLQKLPNKTIEQIAIECGVVRGTVEKWIYNGIVPAKSHQEKVEKITGIKAEYLFPEKEIC